MTTKPRVVPLKEDQWPIGTSPTSRVNQNLVNTLKKYLAAAERGEVDSIAFAISTANGNAVTD